MKNPLQVNFFIAQNRRWPTKEEMRKLFGDGGSESIVKGEMDDPSAGGCGVVETP